MTDIEIVQAIYDALATRDIDTVLARIDPDCVITQDDRLPWGGRHVGQDGYATFGLALISNIESAVTIDAMFSADGEVIQVGRTKGKALTTGNAFDIPEVHRWTIKDGKAVRAHFAIDTPAMLEALGLAG